MAHYWSMLGRTIVTLHSLLFDILVKEWLEESVSRDGNQISGAPVEVGSFFQIFTRFYTSQVVSRISEPSTVSC